ncbi:nucleoside 2-deoxyribosyltransferase [Psychrobacillus sp. FJAT-21963]|uniref:nucleoside 2-deoxyribosyltransferase n=1 Tax=Psychrobacillus sp. FJAT-21963 TaxID=1712028 RepID=UPI0006F84815|nr:nucleoside 2-deoxyribosyltransferase [Psychrobacillus sp. FJAT-21963]KQL35365.1 group-specific protein [Psychrobacillus sp. FJAT-21963]
MKFYIASSFQNIESVKYVSEVLKNKGYIHTYDWTKNERALSIEKLQAIGQEEKNGVMNADILVVLLPAGKGSHIEFGIALGQGKKVFLYSPNHDVRDLETTSTFYHLPDVEIVIGTIDELIDVIFSSNV